MIVLPKSPQTINGEPHVGWWRINRNTGDALGIMDSGFNQGATEDTVITSRASLMLRALNGSFTNATTVAGTNEVELAARLGIQANSAEELGDLFWALARLRTACFDAISAGMGM